MEAQLQIRHIGYQDDKPRFVVVRGSDMKWGSETALTPPDQTIVSGRPNNNLQQDLRWYLEQFLDLPLGANPDTAERVQATLQEWGSACFDSLFQKQARDWFQDARRQGLENLTLKIASNAPRVLAWPWEALHDPEGGTLAHHCRIERQLSELHDPLPLPANLPKDRINILLVIARPYGDKDVGFHALSRPLVELTKAQNSPVHIDVLRPPTFDQLRQTLRDKPDFYHIVHFDGHGGYGTPGHTSPHAFKGMQGMLVFEDNHAEPANVDAGVLSQLMAEHRIPIMVLNACQSAKIDEQADDAFASVAAALLKAGIRSVVAMGYNLYVSGAQQFVPAFYQRLLDSGNVAEAARAGRQAMLAHPERVCVLGEYNLQDWLVPVLYKQLPLGEAVLPNIQRSAPAFVFPGQSETETPLPEAAQYLGDYGFIGRERAVQALERARLQQPQAAFLIHGMAGIGKTTLAKGFLHWLYDTNGLAQALPNGGVFWFSFDEIRSAEYVINVMVDLLFGTNARAAPLPQKLEALIKALREHPFLLVWDNFESASGIAGTEVTALLPEDDRQLLKDLLKRLRGGKTKVLITSRSPENWLTPQECYRLPLSGLQGEELWEYCNAVVRDLGLKIDRRQEDFQKLIAELDGHPLAIRAILLRLPEHKAADLLVELKQQFAGQEGDESTRRIGAVLSLFDRGLPETFAPILQLIGLHERYVDQDYLQAMLQEAEDTAATPHTADCFVALETAGLLHALGQNIYRMHPVLRHYMHNNYPAVDFQKRSFVQVFSRLVEHYIEKELSEKRDFFERNIGSIYAAIKFSSNLSMKESFLTLSFGLGEYFLQGNEIDQSLLIFERLESYCRNDKHTLAIIHISLGQISDEQERFDKAEVYYTYVKDFGTQHKNDFLLSIAYHRLGLINHKQGKFPIAREWYEKAIKLKLKNKEKKEFDLASTFNQFGLLNLQEDDLENALKYLNKSLKIIEKDGDSIKIAETHLNLGSIYSKKRDKNNQLKALEYYNLALQYFRGGGYYEQIAGTINNIVKIFVDLEVSEIPEGLIEESISISEKYNFKKLAATSYALLGRIEFYKDNYMDAVSWYVLSVKIYAEMGDKNNLDILINEIKFIYANTKSEFHEVLFQKWKSAELDYIFTIDQLEQQLNDNT